MAIETTAFMNSVKVEMIRKKEESSEERDSTSTFFFSTSVGPDDVDSTSLSIEVQPRAPTTFDSPFATAADSARG